MKKGALFSIVFILAVVVFLFGIFASSYTVSGTSGKPLTIPVTVSVTVLEWLSVSFSNAPIIFANITPGGTKNADNDPLTIHNGNESNTNIDVYVTIDPYAISSNGTKNFSTQNMKWSNTVNGKYSNYKGNDLVCTNISPGANCYVYDKMNIPKGQAVGSYSVGVTVVAVMAGS